MKTLFLAFILTLTATGLPAGRFAPAAIAQSAPSSLCSVVMIDAVERLICLDKTGVSSIRR